MRRNDNRRAPRAKVRQFARILNLDNKLVAIGFVVDVSAGGAKIETKTAEKIPELFNLSLAFDDSVKRQCAVVWRGENCVGAKFIQRSG